MNAATLAPSKLVYAFDPETREFVGTVTVYLSPDGTYPLPDHTVEVTPAVVTGLFRTQRFTRAPDRWEVVDDYRRVMLYDKATAQPRPNTLALGEALRDDVTVSQPIALMPQDCQRNAWDDQTGTWRTIPDYSNHPVWEKATGLRADYLPPGQPLPPSLTTVPPPVAPDGAIHWDAALAQWAPAPHGEA